MRFRGLEEALGFVRLRLGLARGAGRRRLKVRCGIREIAGSGVASVKMRDGKGLNLIY